MKITTGIKAGEDSTARLLWKKKIQDQSSLPA